MKKTILNSVLTLSILLALSSYAFERKKNENNSLTNKEKMMVSKNKEVVRKLYEESLNKRNYSLLKELVSQDYIGPRGEKGPEGLESSIKPILFSFPEVQWKIEDLLEDVDQVVVHWSWQATHQETYQGIPASNKLVKSEAIAIYQLKNEKITGAKMITDRLGFLLQLGVISADQVPGAQTKNKNK